MTTEAFMQKIHQRGAEAGKLLEGDGGYRIKRGMARGISGYVEDLFALYLAEKIESHELEFNVDKVTSIRLNPNEKAISFKPDVSIVKHNLLTHYFDLKTNMGWNRDFTSYLAGKNQFIESIKDREAWIRHNQNEVQTIKMGNDLIYQMVVIFGWNINQNQLRENLIAAEIYPNVRVYVLYTQNNDGQYGINEEAFNRLHETIKP
jgi:hypothetical protein